MNDVSHCFATTYTFSKGWLLTDYLPFSALD